MDGRKGGGRGEGDFGADGELGVDRFYYSVPFTTRVRRGRKRRRGREGGMAERWGKQELTIRISDGPIFTFLSLSPFLAPSLPSPQGAAQGSTGEQFKRTTELQVGQPFPCCLSRQVGR